MQIHEMIIPLAFAFSIFVMVEALFLFLIYHLTYSKALALSSSALAISCFVAALGLSLALYTQFGSILSATGLLALWLLWWLLARKDFPALFSLVSLIIVLMLVLACLILGDSGAILLQNLTDLSLPFAYSVVISGLLLRKFCPAPVAWLISLISMPSTVLLFLLLLLLLVGPLVGD